MDLKGRSVGILIGLLQLEYLKVLRIKFLRILRGYCCLIRLVLHWSSKSGMIFLSLGFL